MKANIRAILEDCIERGVEHGLKRSRKHSDDPGDEYIMQCLTGEIWLHLDQYFIFEEDE